MKITREMALEIVLRLVGDPDGRVRADAYANVLMPQDKLSKLVRNPKAEREEKIAVASNPNTLPEDLDFLTNDSVTWGVKEAVAKNPSTRIETLEKLAKDKHYSVKQAVLCNPNVTPEILEELSHDPNLWTRKAVLDAINKNAKEAEWFLLKKDRLLPILFSIFENKGN